MEEERGRSEGLERRRPFSRGTSGSNPSSSGEPNANLTDGLDEDWQSRFASRGNGSGGRNGQAHRIVGIGIMGTAMMRNLVKDGFEVVGYDIADWRCLDSRLVVAPRPRRTMSAPRRMVRW